MPLQEVVQALQSAIEASVYVEPAEPGLTIAEICEIGKRLGFRDGEITDALRNVVTPHFGEPDRRLLLADHFWQMSGHFLIEDDPEWRNLLAFDFVVEQLNDRVKDVGAARASLNRRILVARAQSRALSAHDVEYATTILVLSGQLLQNDNGELRFAGQTAERPLPSVTAHMPGAIRRRFSRPARTRVLPHVRDVIQRRTDGRPKNIDPFPAFAEHLGALGYGHFRLWWSQTVAELGCTDTSTSPLSALVLAAALVEGALTFVVKHAQALNLGVFGSTDFKKDPKTWRIDDLVESAARGGESAILDTPTKNRAQVLIQTRQRIHAGRMLSEYPSGVSDLRPEEARDAKAVAEQVVRRVVDWLAKFPA